MKTSTLLTLALVGLALPSSGQTWLTNAEIFDFEIGDEFHYSLLYWTGPPTGQRRTITDKWYSAEADTVFYERAHDNYSSEFFPTPEPHVEYTFYQFTDTVFYTALNALPTAFDGNPEDYSEWGFWGDTTGVASPQYCDSIVNEYSYTAGEFEPDYWQRHFGEGLGIVLNSHTNAGEGVEYGVKLDYFKKGDAECGTPDLTVGVTELSSPIDILPYPNPSHTDFHWQPHCDYRLESLAGKLVKQGLSAREVSVRTLPAGTYLLHLTLDGAIETHRVVVK